MKKVVVTGASGHVGFHVASELLERGYETHLLIRSENVNIFKLKQKGAELHNCKLDDPETYRDLLTTVDAAFHLAAENTTSKSNADRVIQNTAGITETFLAACVKAGVKTMVYTSSVVVIGRSESKLKLLTETERTKFIESPYVEGKIKAEEFVEKLVREADADIRIVYPSWVVGPNDPRTTPPHKIITDYVAKGQPFYFEGGISLASVVEIAKAQVNALERGTKQGKYILGGDNVTFRDFYHILSSYTKHAAPFIKFPKWLIVNGARATAPLFKAFGMQPILEPSYAKSVFGNYSWYDSSKAVHELDYKIVPAREILSAAVEDANIRITATMNLGIQRKPYTKEDDTKGKLLITGAPGWLGNRMIDILINGDKEGDFQSNRKVKLLVQPQHAGLLNLPSNFELVYGDITDEKVLEEVLTDVNVVFHLAGAIYPPRIKTLYKVNEEGTKKLVDACIAKGIRRIIYMSTDSVCGSGTKSKRIFDEFTPPSPYKNYGKSKYFGEKYLLDKSREGLVDGTALRGFWFFGPFAPPRQMNFLNMFNWPRQIVFGNGKNFRSISHVDNSIQAFFKAEKESKTFGRWYWICGNESTLSVDQIYKTIAEKLEKDYKPFHIPNWMCGLFGLADTLLGKLGYLNSTLHAAGKFHFDIAGNIDAAKRDFDYTPKIDFEEAASELKGLIH
ncbi:NAD-dependent epimerase/dehydratase family protein [Bacteroidota bacterium]